MKMLNAAGLDTFRCIPGKDAASSLKYTVVTFPDELPYGTY
jgi:hypothetical protein